jgi:hypothetical protein
MNFDNRLELNNDWIARDEYIFGDADPKKYLGGVRHYENLDIGKLRWLKMKKFLKPEEKQNYAPTIDEFMKFMGKYPKVKAHGYVVSLNRSDYRISIEGLMFTGIISHQLQKDFVELCRQADEFRMEDCHLFAWWD